MTKPRFNWIAVLKRCESAAVFAVHFGAVFDLLPHLSRALSVYCFRYKSQARMMALKLSGKMVEDRRFDLDLLN